MAAGNDDLCASFERFAILADKDKPKDTFTVKACGKLVNDCWSGKYKDARNIVDASVFSKWKQPKGSKGMPINKDNCNEFVTKTAHELAKRKAPKILADAPEVIKIKADLCTCLLGGGPKVKEVKQSATGNVGALTDTKNYTGAHKERFDESGKGKGADGRTNKADNSGYVGNYKGSGTFEKKK